MKDYINQS